MRSQWYVVGDKFSSFISLSRQKIISIRGLLARIEQNPKDNSIYRIGQGVSDAEIDKLNEVKNKNNNFQFIMAQQREDKKFVHKLKNKNVMISKPVKLNEKLFQSSLIVDDNCAEMSDHITGHHIQGMVIIEAARQLMLSVTENYFLQNNENGEKSIILDSISSAFTGFIFPINADIFFKIENFKLSKLRDRYHAHIYFQQGNKKLVKIDMKYSLYDKSWLTKRETILATEFI